MYQELTIVGILGKDPEMRYTAEGKATAGLNVATSRNTAKGDKETTWFRVTCWEKTAEYMNSYAQKGTKILVRGRLVVDPQTGGPRVFTKNDGTPSSTFEVVADTVKLIAGYKTPDANHYQNQAQAKPVVPQQRQAAPQDDDGIPW